MDSNSIRSSHRPELGSVSWTPCTSPVHPFRYVDCKKCVCVCIDHAHTAHPSLSDSRSCKASRCGQVGAGISRAVRLPQGTLGH